MVRISKLTDYAVVIMTHIADCAIQNSASILQAREIAEHTHLSLTTVSKLLKVLTKHKFLASLRGTNGGYQLAVLPEKISIVDLIQALEGPLAITECNLGHAHCSSETQCAIRTPWLHINQIITQALAAVKLSDLVKMSTSNSVFSSSGNNQARKFITNNNNEPIFNIKVNPAPKSKNLKDRKDPKNLTKLKALKHLKNTASTLNSTSSRVHGEQHGL